MDNRRLKDRRPSVAQIERDAALQRVSTTRRWVIGGAAGLSAGIAAFVSAIAPGHSLGAKTANAATLTPSGGGSGQATARASTASKKMPPLAKPSDLGLSGPAVGPTAPSDSGGAGNTGAGASGNSGPGPSGNSGNTGNTGNTGASAGNTGASAGNTGPAPSPAPPAPTVSSGGS